RDAGESGENDIASADIQSSNVGKVAGVIGYGPSLPSKNKLLVAQLHARTTTKIISPPEALGSPGAKVMVSLLDREQIYCSLPTVPQTQPLSVTNTARH